MNNDKNKVLLVFEDGKPALDSTAGRIQAALNKSREVKLRQASKVSIQEVLAADCYIFGVYKAESVAWKELQRLFKGINLAGRQAAFFTDDIRESGLLREAFKDADMIVSSPDLLIQDGVDVSAWAHGALAGA